MEQVGELVVRAATAVTLDERVEAYGQLVERFRDMACGYAYSILGDFHLAEDAAQEAFVTAYQRLDQLREPEAYPGWFRSIVWTTCGQIARRKSMPTVPMDAVRQAPAETLGPSEMAEAAEMRDEVLRSISQLPDREREVTTLFYINGYSQKDIADFLEVPVGTVKNRLTASRSRLKRRMLNMVKDTLHKNAPDERFDQRVIQRLLGQPNLLRIDGHPVRQVLDAIRRDLAEFEFVEAEEIVRPPEMAREDRLAQAFQVEDGRILSYETTISVLQTAKDRQPPLRLIAAGRSFRAIGETAWISKAFHQMDALCIEAEASEEKCVALLRRVLGAALGSEEFVHGETNPLWYAKKYRAVRASTGPIPVAGYGMVDASVLAKLGYDTTAVGGYAVDVGLDRLAMLRYKIDDIRKLWQPPYVAGTRS